MAALAKISEIVAYVRGCGSPVPVSVALGEAVEWTSNRPFPRLPGGITYLKLGTAGLAGCAGWETSLGALLRRFNVELDRSNDPAAANSATAVVGGFAPSWIAVAYADWQIARGPAPQEVIAAAAACDCVGVLIDTFAK